MWLCRLCSHARARDSVAQCVRHGVDVIYHASYIDEVTMDELEKNKHHHIVAPGINWLYATTYEAGPFGYSFDKAETDGYKKELDVAIRACKEMHQRGITVLPYASFTCPPKYCRAASNIHLTGVVTMGLPGHLTGHMPETWSILLSCLTLLPWNQLSQPLLVWPNYSCKTRSWEKFSLVTMQT